MVGNVKKKLPFPYYYFGFRNKWKMMIFQALFLSARTSDFVFHTDILKSIIIMQCTFWCTFSDINRQPFFGEDPSHYVDEVKQSLATERGLNPRNRELVMEVLGRLAERVQSAEHSRNAVVNELVSLRERFQVRERIWIWIFPPNVIFVCLPWL